jgi:hypothetical protein
MPETYVTDKAGLVPLAVGFRDGHPAVWLADRACRWSCPHDCHAAPRPVRYEAVMLPGFDLVGTP